MPPTSRSSSWRRVTAITSAVCAYRERSTTVKRVNEPLTPEREVEVVVARVHTSPNLLPTTSCWIALSVAALSKLTSVRVTGTEIGAGVNGLSVSTGAVTRFEQRLAVVDQDVPEPRVLARRCRVFCGVSGGTSAPSSLLLLGRLTGRCSRSRARGFGSKPVLSRR